MFNFLRVLLFICLSTIVLESSAQQQENALVSGNFQGMSFEQFVKKVESQTDFHFYFKSAETQGISINLEVQDRSISSLLEEALQDTGLEYAIDPATSAIFITLERKLLTTLPSGFFDREKMSATEEEQVVVDPYAERANLKRKNAGKLYEIGTKTNTIKAGKAILKGRVRDANSGEPVYGASILIEEPFIGVSTDQFGHYTITLPKGRHTLKISSMGMLEEEREIMLYSEGTLDIELVENVVSLKEVVISSQRDRNVTQAQMGVEKISAKSIKQVPTVMGEADILRVVQTLPGVKTVGEASTGFNVRGGSVDQNLILFNEATVYNPSHLFGFFSAFNSDVIDGVELYKSSIPAKYGGRLSSVLDVSPKMGNKKKFAGKAGIGLLTSRLMVEGPLIKDKTSFVLGARSTYSSWLLNLLNNDDFKNIKGSFYDLNLNLDHEVNETNIISLTAYHSQDQFKLRSDTLYEYGNQNATLKWRHIFGEKLYGVMSASYSSYDYSVASDANPVNAFGLSFGLNQLNMKGDFTYSLNSRHTLNLGAASVLYSLQPGAFLPNGSESGVTPDVIEPERALENALFIEDQFEVNDRLSLNVGLRYSLYQYLGPKNTLSYAAGLPKTEDNVLDTLSFGSGDIIKTYHGPEYRLSGRYMLSNALSVKFGYNTLRQYIHMLSNSTAVSPTDIWKLSDPNLRPQFGDQLSLGLYKNFRSGKIETSVEGYYKNIRDYLDYKGGAVLVMNHAIETDVVSTEGKAYGVEFLLKKPSGNFNGWLSYTWSRTLLRVENENEKELINRGAWYPANFDKPHDFTFVGNYKFSHRFSVSLNCTYSTGRPITLPIAKYNYAGSQRVLYSDRNAYRLPDYFRTDIAMNIEGNHNLKQRTHNSWSIGVYNLTGRRNVYSTYFVSEGGAINGYKLSIFGTAIPYVNFNIRF